MPIDNKALKFYSDPMVTVTNGVTDSDQDAQEAYLRTIIRELRKINMHLSLLTDVTINDSDVEV